MTIDTQKLAEYCADNNTMMEILSEVERAEEETVLYEREREVLVLYGYGFRPRQIQELIEEFGTIESTRSKISKVKKKAEKARGTVELADRLEEKEYGRVEAT